MRLLETIVALVFLLMVIIAVLNLYKLNEQYKRYRENLFAVPELAGVLSYIVSMPGDLSANITLDFDNMTELRIYVGYESKYKVARGVCIKKDFWNDMKDALKQSVLEALNIDLLLLSKAVYDYYTNSIDEQTFKYATIKAADFLSDKVANRVLAKLGAKKLAEKIAQKVAKKVGNALIGRIAGMAVAGALGGPVGLLVSFGISFAWNAASVIYDWIVLKTNPEKTCVSIDGNTWEWNEGDSYELFPNRYFSMNVWKWYIYNDARGEGVKGGFMKYRGIKILKWITIKKKENTGSSPVIEVTAAG